MYRINDIFGEGLCLTILSTYISLKLSTQLLNVCLSTMCECCSETNAIAPRVLEGNHNIFPK
jgi:hypothetical protein